MKTLVTLFILLLAQPSLGQNKIYRMSIDGVINPASAEFINKTIAKANEDRAMCLVIELDTPGGLMKSMNLIVKDILASEVPVIVYVSPGGSHCASAGVFIMMAAHISAMAPGTNIGAAHPVNLGEGKTDSLSQVMMEKVTNDAVSYIRSIAEKNKRNPDWAEEAVRKSVSITETQALEINVIDMVAKSFDSLLVQIDSMIVETVVGKKTIVTNGAQIEKIERSWRFGLLDILTDPNIAYILMMLGMYGLFFEFYNPGSIFPGVVGGICIILAFYSFQTLPINYAGLALILFGLILFLLEIKVTSYGALSIGGVISLFLGSIMLIDSPEDMVRISWGVIIPVVLITLLFFLFVVGFGIKAQGRRVTTGMEGMIGETGIVIDGIIAGKTGKIRVHGEIWNAESDQVIETETRVKVVGIDNLTLKVVKLF
ncbi:nodulation protein NfeD [bacterium]|nr:MAG: nodulation protein NfeD [bacterium]